MDDAISRFGDTELHEFDVHLLYLFEPICELITKIRRRKESYSGRPARRASTGLISALWQVRSRANIRRLLRHALFAERYSLDRLDGGSSGRRVFVSFNENHFQAANRAAARRTGTRLADRHAAQPYLLSPSRS